MSNDASNDGGRQATVASDLDPDSETASAVRRLVEESREGLSASERFDPDSLFEMLADPGHRYVLTYLLQSEGAVACSELVDYVTERTSTTMNPEQFRQRVVSELTNTYLPRLDEYGFVKYNMERQIVGPTDRTPLARPYLLIALAQQESVKTETDE